MAKQGPIENSVHALNISTMMKTTLAIIYSLTLSIPTNIDAKSFRQDLYENLKEEIKLQLSIAKTNASWILYDRLKTRNIGTNEIEMLARKTTIQGWYRKPKTRPQKWNKGTNRSNTICKKRKH